MAHKKMKRIYIEFYRKPWRMGKKPSMVVMKYYDDQKAFWHKYSFAEDEFSVCPYTWEPKGKLLKQSEIYLMPKHFEQVKNVMKQTHDRPTQVHVSIFKEILLPMPEFDGLVQKIEPDNASLHDMMKIMTLGGF